MPAWVGMSVKSALILILTGGSAVAEEARPAPAEVIAELTAAYAKLGGFTATYRAVGEGKTLESTLGLDELSGLAALDTIAKKEGHEMTFRQWNTSDDQLFMGGGDDLFVIKGMNEELQSLADLAKVLTVLPEGLGNDWSVQLTPSILLEKTSFGAAVRLIPRDTPFWGPEVKDAPIKESDEKSVTFLTEEYGLLTISRENGLLIRQSVTADDGEVRVLELKEFHLNPGKDAIKKISADWSATGAKEKPVVAWLAPVRLVLFQAIIDFAEQGQADKGKLDELLEDQYEALRHFAKACINESEGTVASRVKWPELFTKVKEVARDKWREESPEADATDEKAFLAYRQKPEVFLELRNSVVTGILTSENAPELILDDIFGRGGWASLKVGNDLGVATKKSLVNALSRAYLEALVDLKMAKEWDQRDGLD